MKTEKMKIKNTFVVLVVLTLFVTTSFAFMNVKAESSDDELAFPEITVTTTATVDVRTDVALSLQVLQSIPVVPEGQIGIHAIKPTKTGLSITLTGRIGMTSDSEGLSDVAIGPEIDHEEKKDSWQLALFLDKGTNLYENTTDFSDTFTISTDFNSLTYQYLAISRARSRATSNSSIVVTYADSLSANISDSDDVTNVTIYNNFLPTRQLLWFRLDLEISNSSRPYVLNIAGDEFDADAVYVFSMPSEQDFRDTRYLEVKLGTDAWVNISDLNAAEDWKEIATHQVDYTEKWTDNTVKGAGFETVDSFEDSLKEAWVAIINNEIGALDGSSYSSISTGQIVDYRISSASLDTMLNARLSSAIYSSVKNAAAQSSDLNTYTRAARAGTIRRFTM